MNTLAIAKTVAGVVASAGAGAIVSNAAKSTFPAKSRTIQKITLGVGAYVLASMVGDLATKHVEESIDNAATQIQAIKDAVTSAKETES
jgi:hypothetical protein